MVIKQSILLVEDEPWMGELYRQLLTPHYDVLWVRDGYDAIDAIDRAQPDVIVLDIMLPWVNGMQLLHELASYSDTSQIPVILFSVALPDTISSEALRAYGVREVVDKSAVKPKQVVETIKRVLAYANH